MRICGSAIQDVVDESIHCEGACKRWFYRYCAGIPTRLFEELSASTDPFSCLYCNDTSNKSLIQSLKDEVAALKAEVAVSRASLQSSTPPTVDGSDPSLSQERSFAAAVAGNTTASLRMVGESP